MSAAPIVDRIRIIPRPTDFLDRNVGASGEVFFSKETNTLRVYSGKDRSGFELARADLANVDTSALNLSNPYDTLDDLPAAADSAGNFAYVVATGKMYYAHGGNWIELASQGSSSGGASVDVSDTVPSSPESGNLWLDTNTGKLYIYITDNDSSQWIQPNSAGFSGDYNDLINKPDISGGGATAINELTDVDTETNPPTVGQVLKWDGTNWAPAADVTTGGGGTDADTLDGQDGTYYLNYNNLSNKPTSFENLSLTGTASVAAASFSGAATFNNLVTLQQTTEILTPLTGATGVVAHDLDNGAVFYHNSLSANFTVNITNVPTTDNRTVSVVLLLNQGGTAYVPTALQINSSSESIRWQGGSQPTGNANKLDVVSFTLIRTGGAWSVIGSLTVYG